MRQSFSYWTEHPLATPFLLRIILPNVLYGCVFMVDPNVPDTNSGSRDSLFGVRPKGWLYLLLILSWAKSKWLFPRPFSAVCAKTGTKISRDVQTTFWPSELGHEKNKYGGRHVDLWAFAQGNINIALRNYRIVEGWCMEIHSARKSGYIKWEITWLHELKQNSAKLHVLKLQAKNSRTGEIRNVTS